MTNTRAVRIPIAVLFFCVSFAASALKVEAQQILNLETSISKAIADNYSLKAEKEKTEQSLNVKRQARADFLPKLGTRYGYTRLSEVPTFRAGGNIPMGDQDNYQWMGMVSQPVFTGFALLSSYQLAKLGLDQSETEYEMAKLDLALRVKEAYFDILITDKAVEVAGKDVESRESNVKTARSFYDVGMIPVNDLLKAEVELANSRQNLIKAQNAAKLARSVFNIVLSRQINDPAEVEDILVYKPEQGAFDEYVAMALANRPEIKLIDLGLLQADQQINLARSTLYPVVSVEYDYIKEGDHPDVSGGPFHDAGHWQAMALCTWTFWEWGKTHYTIREKESFKKELLQNRTALEDQIRLELRQAVLEMKTAEENIPTTEKAVEQGEENLRVNDERYKAQVTTITEVLDAQSLLSQARVNYYRALYSHNLARARLQRALGKY
jgi:outer membrane protein